MCIVMQGYYNVLHDITLIPAGTAAPVPAPARARVHEAALASLQIAC